MVYGLVGPEHPLEGRGGFFPVWQDPAGECNDLNNGRRVDPPHFSRSSGDHPAGGLSGITPAVSLGKSKNPERNSCHSLRACLSKEA